MSVRGIPPELNQRLRDVLLRCGPFDGNAELRAVFADTRLRPWRDRVPETSNRQMRVMALIDLLLDVTNTEGQSALMLFVQVVRDLVDPGARCYDDLLEVERALWVYFGGTLPEADARVTSPLYVQVAASETEELNLRSLPDVAAGGIIDRISNGTLLEVLEAATDAAAKVGQSGRWLHVRTPDGLDGYVAAWYVRLPEDDVLDTDTPDTDGMTSEVAEPFMLAPTPYDGKLYLVVWRADTTPGETVADLATLLRATMPNVAGVMLKTSNGADWQGHLAGQQGGEQSVTSVASLRHWVDTFASYGLEVHIWGVPRARSAEEIVREATVLSSAANVPGVRSLLLDVEQGYGYWEGSPDDVRALMERVRASTRPDLHIGLILDGRRTRPFEVWVDPWIPFVDSLHPMVYPVLFGSSQSIEQHLDVAFRNLEAYHKPLVPLLQAFAEYQRRPTPEEIIQQAEAAWARGAAGLSFFRLGTDIWSGDGRPQMGELEYAAIAQIAVQDEPAVLSELSEAAEAPDLLYADFEDADELFPAQDAARTETETDLLIRVLAYNPDVDGYDSVALVDGDVEVVGDPLRPDIKQLTWGYLDDRTYGELLYEALRAAQGRALDEAFARVEATFGRLRLRLDMAPDLQELHALRWENLQPVLDDQQPTTVLGAARFFRYVATPFSAPPLITARPARMVLAVANPRDVAAYDAATWDVAAEMARFHEALAPLCRAGRLHVTVMPGVSSLPQTLARQLSDDGYEILSGPTSLDGVTRVLRDSGAALFHLFVRGLWEERGRGWRLLFEDGQGGVRLISTSHLVSALGDELVSPALAFLSSPQMDQPDPEAGHPFTAVASDLVRAGVPSALAVLERISIEAESAFAGDFYRALLDGVPVDVALYEARVDDESPPLLATRLVDGRLFAPDPWRLLLESMAVSDLFDPAPGVAATMPQEVVHLEVGEDFDPVGVMARDGPRAEIDVALPFDFALGVRPARCLGLVASPGMGASLQLRRLGRITAERSLEHAADRMVIPLYVDLARFPVEDDAGWISVAAAVLSDFGMALADAEVRDLIAAPEGPVLRWLLDNSDKLSGATQMRVFGALASLVAAHPRHEYIVALDGRALVVQPSLFTDLLVLKPPSPEALETFLIERAGPYGPDLFKALAAADSLDLIPSWSAAWMLLAQARDRMTERRLTPDEVFGWLAGVYDLTGAQLEAVAAQWRRADVAGTLPELAAAMRRVYRVRLNAPSRDLTVGETLGLGVQLLPATPDEEGVITLPSGGEHLHAFVSADGLRVVGREVAAVHLNPETRRPIALRFDLQARLCGERTFDVTFFAGMGEGLPQTQPAIVRLAGSVTVAPPPEEVVAPPLLPVLDLRADPEPDLVVRVAMAGPDPHTGAHRLTYTLSSRLPGLRYDNEEVGGVTITLGYRQWLSRRVGETLASVQNRQPADVLVRMRGLGRLLFDHFVPEEGASALRQAFARVETFRLARQREAFYLPTLLMVEEPGAWLPWELMAPVVPYDAGDGHAGMPFTPAREAYKPGFLVDTYGLSRWVEGLGPPLYSEIPLGEVALIHDRALAPEQVEVDPGLRAWQQLLRASAVADGIGPVVRDARPYYGLHLQRVLRDGAAHGAIVPLHGAHAPEREVEPARLDLRRKRPVVTLGIHGREEDGGAFYGGLGSDAWLAAEQVLPFLRAGASALAASWWPVSEAANGIFYATLYDLLAGRVRWGEAVWRARQAVRHALPERPDWLAYAAFGDPRARPYWPEASQGYTALVCLNPEQDQTLRPGETYYFQVTIGREPPVWFQGRLLETEALARDVQVLFVAPGLQTSTPEPQPVVRVGQTLHQATVSLTPSQAGHYVLMAQLLEGNRNLDMLQLSFEVREEVGAD